MNKLKSERLSILLPCLPYTKPLGETTFMENYEALFQRLQSKSRGLGISLNPPALREELQELENSLMQKLPMEVASFYRFCNGFETDDFLFRILPVHEVLKYKDELGATSFYFAEYMIYSDTWTISIHGPEQYVIINSDHQQEEPIYLTNSIFDFVERYIGGGGVFGNSGLYKWLKQKKVSKN